MNCPDFFIAGTPKAGTSSLYSYLQRHPDIAMSSPKEPHYFCSDFSPELRVGRTLDDYMKRCFEGFDDGAKLKGEATSTYLYSEVAISEILSVNPEAKFIVMLRNPYEMAQAVHAQCLRDSDEEVLSFSSAWRLQASRAVGQNIPAQCREKKFLLYKLFCSVGSQVERLLERVPERNIKFVFFEDFCNSTEAEYRAVLAFLGVQFDGQEKFSIRNKRKALKSLTIGRVLNRPPSFLVGLFLSIKKVLKIPPLGILKKMRSLNEKNPPRIILDTEVIDTLADVFDDEIEKLSTLTKRNLTSWKRG